MPSPVRVGTTRGGRSSVAPQSDQRTYDGAMSVYGSTRADSVGYMPPRPKPSYSNKAAKAYRGSENGEADK